MKLGFESLIEKSFRIFGFSSNEIVWEQKSLTS